MKKQLPLVIGVIVILGVLLVFTSQLQTNSQVRFVEGTNVACLPNGHQQLALHVHPTLAIFVDGEREPIPANVGIIGSCMSEMHTHDTSGTLHIETASRARFNELSLSDFFDVWGQPLDREGYTMEVSVNGTPVSSVDEVPLEDLAQIELRYTSISEEG